MGLLVKSTAK